MINYRIAGPILQPLLPAGTELDPFEGEHFVSLVGFQFLKTKALGIGFPYHRNFEEVNLRFYVRARDGGGWRRGVVFVRELVPRWAIAFVARRVYGEPYLALPMRHQVTDAPGAFSASYEWRRKGAWELLRVSGIEAPAEIASESMEEYITEHYWGFTRHGARSTQYGVEHPRWRVRPAERAEFKADIASLYGACFVEALTAEPHSAFLAEGSPVKVRVHSAVS
jgi:hypothetical protein